MLLNIIWILYQISLAHKKNSTSRNKDILNTVPTYWINKNRRFWTFSAKNPSTIFQYEFGFLVVCCFVCIVLYAATEIDIFNINWSDRNCLKSWRATYLKKRLYTYVIIDVVITLWALPVLWIRCFFLLQGCFWFNGCRRWRTFLVKSTYYIRVNLIL